VDRFVALLAARRGLAFVVSGIVIDGLHAARVTTKRERVEPRPGRGNGGNGAEP
jgi:hypothetical protein